MNEINVEKIMDEIRREIPGQEAEGPLPRFEDIPVSREADIRWDDAADVRALDKALAQASSSVQVAFFRPVPGGRVKGFIKRLLRKLIRFCVEPICRDTTAFHQAALSSLGTLRRFVREALVRGSRRDEELALLRAEVEELRGRIAELERRP